MLDSKFWIGVIEDRNDPLKLGRCRVRVFGVHTENTQELPTDKLNWAHPVFPLNNPNTYAPKEGDTVVGFFMDGEDGQFPMMLGVTPGIPSGTANTAFGFNDPRTEQQLQNAPKKPDIFGEGVGKYPRVIDEPTTSRLARNENISTSQFQVKREKLIQGSPEIVQPIRTVYPYNNVYESESGHALEFDDTPDSERVHLFHRNGSYIEMLPDGSTNQKTEKNKVDTVRGRNTIYVGEDLTVIVKGDVVYAVDGDFTVACDNFNVGARSKVGISSGTSASVSAGLNASFSSKGYTSISAMGYVSVSAMAYASMSAWGPLTLSSKALASLGAPICKIGILGALAGTQGAAESAGSAAGTAATSAAGAAASSMTSSVGSFLSVDPGSWSVNFTNFAGVPFELPTAGLTDTFSSVLGNTEGFFSSLSGTITDAFAGFSDTIGSAFNSVTNGISNAFSGLKFDSFKSFSNSLEGFQQSIGQVAADIQGAVDLGRTAFDVASSVGSIISDPIGSILNGQAIGAFNQGLSQLGVNVDGLTNSALIKNTKDLLNTAQDAYAVGTALLASGNPIQALATLSEAADIFNDSEFLSGLSESVSSVTNAVRNSAIASTFNQIRQTVGDGAAAITQVSGAIRDTYNTFVDAAGLDFLGQFPNATGMEGVLIRVADTMRNDSATLDNVSKMIIDGYAVGSSEQEIQDNIRTYLTESYAINVQEELAASPITLLNVVQATGVT